MNRIAKKSGGQKSGLQKSGIVRYAFGTALAAALLAGGAGLSQVALADRSASDVESRSTAKALARAEKAVAKAPRNAALRVTLGQAYISAGRFESAEQAFRDALSLGDASGSTALSLALAQVATGNSAGATATLDQWREAIPASDFGLALALAGETSRGVAILADALRAGEASAKLRQNLAYAYALDGRWQEARVMASQDVPADQLDSRISDWAMQGRPEEFRQRVAVLLAVPLRTDAGQPDYLALDAGTDATPQFAAAAPAPFAPAADAELAPLAEPDSFAEASPASEPSAFQAAFAEAPAAARPAAGDAPGFVSNPVVQPLPARAIEREASAATPARIQRVTYRKPAAAASGASDTHRVQLGSFLSEERARRAWSIFVGSNPELRSYRLLISQALVKGRNYWRVAAGGLDSRGASSLCSSVRGRGSACIAYAASRPLPGAVPARGSAGAMMARR